MDMWTLCYDKDCIHHDLLVNLLFNHFMNQGLNVYVEIPLSIPPINHSRIRIGNKGELVVESKVKFTSKIDLVTVSDDDFIRGYEVETHFNDIGREDTFNQLIGYICSGYFDELYLVVPENICKRVMSSYGQCLSCIGVGLLCIDLALQRINIVIKPKHLSKRRIPNLYFNHAWIKHMVMTYLRSQGYCVYPEIYVPKPLSTLPKIAPLQNNPQRYLNRIDLIAVRGDCAPCDIVCGVCEGDVIGIEVKYDKSRLGPGELQKLRDYLGSGVISKMYLALDNRSNVNGVLGQVRGLADVLVVDPLSRSVVFRHGNAVHVKPRLCAFVFENPSGNKLHVYSYRDLCRYRHDIPISYTLNTWSVAAGYVVNVVSRLCQKNSMCLYLGCGRIIYVKRAKSSHVIRVI